MHDTCPQEWLRFLDSLMATITLAINVYQTRRINQNQLVRRDVARLIRLAEKADSLEV